MTTPHVPLLLPVGDVKLLSALIALQIKQLAPVTNDQIVLEHTAALSEIKAKLDDALKRLKEVNS